MFSSDHRESRIADCISAEKRLVRWHGVKELGSLHIEIMGSLSLAFLMEFVSVPPCSEDHTISVTFLKDIS